MRQFLSIIFILSFCAKFSAQSDTVDYTIFLTNNKLSLIRVLEGKDKKQLYFKYKAPIWCFEIKAIEDRMCQGATFIAVGDTALNSDWDLEKGNQLISTHSVSKVKLNKAKNIISLKKMNWHGTNYVGPIDRKFEIIKWTKFEIILKDLDYPQLNRLYVFREIVVK
jgi:hypothetical protein